MLIVCFPFGDIVVYFYVYDPLSTTITEPLTYVLVNRSLFRYCRTTFGTPGGFGIVLIREWSMLT